MKPSQSRLIRRYYEHNTRRFLGRGAQRQTGTIHLAVWAPGVTDSAAALHYVHGLVSAQVQELPAPRLLDLGCGAGASLLWLAQHLPHLTGLGVTISPLQARLAGDAARRAGLAARAAFCTADFLELPAARGQFHLAYAIEAFAHTDQPARFFQAAARLLTPSGRLALCDHFLTPAGAHFPELVRLWQAHWRTPGAQTVAAAHALAESAGLHPLTDLNLTPYLRLRPLPGWLLAALRGYVTRFAPHDEHLRSILGGQALQACLASGLVEYRWQVWARA